MTLALVASAVILGLGGAGSAQPGAHRPAAASRAVLGKPGEIPVRYRAAEYPGWISRGLLPMPKPTETLHAQWQQRQEPGAPREAGGFRHRRGVAGDGKMFVV